MTIPLVIPAAGLGSRLFPATWGIPKELFPLGNKPALHYVLDEAKSAGINEVICITSPRKEALSTYLSYKNDTGLSMNMTTSERERLYILDKLNSHFTYKFAIQEEAKGVGNALMFARNQIKTDAFCMAYPDDLLHDCEYGLKQLIAAHHKYKNAIVIAVEHVAREKITAYGVIAPGAWLDSHTVEIQKIVEKPSAIDAPSEFGIVGRYVLTSDILNYMQAENVERPCFISALNRAIASGKKVIAVVLQTKRYDIGTVPGWIYTINALNS